MNKLKSSFSSLKNKPQLILLVFGVAFLFLYSWLYTSTATIFNSPDETATFVFVKQFVTTGDFSIPFEPNPNNLIRPRSVNISDNNFVPGGFVGLPLVLGIIGKFIGVSAVSYLPSIIAIIAVLCAYHIFKKVFSHRIAFFSAISMYFFPAWWHYTAKGYLPNVVFLSFLLISIATILLAHEKWKNNAVTILFFFLAGLSGGLALIIRPNELWWILLSLIVLAFVYRKQIAWKKMVFALIPFCCLFAGFFFYQSELYGSALSTGYDQLQSGTNQSLISRIVSSFFPFGIDLIQVGKTSMQFLLQLFWWHTALVIIGLISWVKNPLKTNEQKIYTGLFAGISLYLFVYYGAWQVVDDLDRSRVSIGISYIRYWLPYFILSLPYMLLALQFIASRFKKKAGVFVLLFAVILLGQSLYIYQGKDGLRKIQQTIVNYNKIQQELITTTESDAIIVGERIDKIIWPQRQVIHFQDQDFSFVEKLDETMDYYPVYWLTLLPYDHVQVWEQTVFATHNLRLVPVNFSIQGYALYAIEYDNNI